MKYLLHTALLAASISAASMAQTRIMVMSDPHVLTASNAATLADNACNATGKLDKMSPHIFNQALANILQAKPEALLISGDLTYNGERSGHSVVSAALAQIEAAGIPVLVIPGNHDILNPHSIDAVNPKITAEEFKTFYGAFGYGDDDDIENVSYDVKSLSWAASLKGTDLAIIGLDASIYDETDNYYSDGCLRKSTLDWMATQAAALQAKGKMVIGMVHQELLDHVPMQSMLAQSTLLNTLYTKNPVDGAEEEAVTRNQVMKAFADADIHYVLTGHFHIHNTVAETVKDSNGEDFSLTELTTGGLTTYPNWTRLLTFDTEQGTMDLSASSMIQMQLAGTSLQSISKVALTTWATNSYGSIPMIVSAITQLKDRVDLYEIIDATTQYQTEADAYANVMVTRDFKSHAWQSLYLPFDLAFEDWSEDFDVAVLNSSTPSSLGFKLMAAGETLEKNTPALIRLKEEKSLGLYSILSSVKSSSKTSVNPVDGQTADKSVFTLTGTYAGLTGDFMHDNTCYALSSGVLKTVGDGADGSMETYLFPQRWYMTTMGASPKSVTITIEDEATAIGTIETDSLSGAIYSLDGRKQDVKDLNELSNGAYIINRKVIIR